MEKQNELIKICDIIFSITDFDITLLDKNLAQIFFLTKNTYPNILLKHYPDIFPELLSHLGSCTGSACFWHKLPALEIMYLDIRIQVSETEYYYALIGPALMDSYTEAIIKKVLNNFNISLSYKEAIRTFYKSLPSYNVQVYNSFLTAYHLLTAIDHLEPLPVFPSEINTEMYHNFKKNTFSDNVVSARKDIEWNYSREILWRSAISRGDLSSAKKAIHDMSTRDYLFHTPLGPLRSQKNILISINALCRAAAYDGGVEYISVHKMHDSFSLLVENISNSLEAVTLLNKMLEDYCRLVIESRSQGYSPFVKKAVELIYTYYKYSLTLHAVAKAIPCGESHLSRCFHSETGKTFTAFLNDVRIENAISLLNTNEYTITEIALMVGYSSYTKFSVAFKKYTGKTAREYLNAQKVTP